MIPAALSLTITTPLARIVNSDDVLSLRAEDDSGAFGVLPGHVDLLSALNPCVVRWRDGQGRMHYCAVHGGVLTVAGGRSVRIACREAVAGDDLKRLEEDVSRHRAAEEQAASSERIARARLHARAIRQIMSRLSGETQAAHRIFE